jgi:hypothetical protein
VFSDQVATIIQASLASCHNTSWSSQSLKNLITVRAGYVPHVTKNPASALDCKCTLFEGKIFLKMFVCVFLSTVEIWHPHELESNFEFYHQHQVTQMNQNTIAYIEEQVLCVVYMHLLT